MPAGGVTKAPNPASNYFDFESKGRANVSDEAGLRKEGIDGLVREAVFGTPEVQAQARSLIWQASQQLGCPSASIQGLYAARGRGLVKGFTVPAMNLRGLTYDVARSALRAALRLDVGALVFEIAKSEMGYTHQSPEEYATVLLSAAIKEHWRRPVFVQGDHFQFHPKKYAQEATKETEGIRKLVRDSLSAGFLNIDIDASTLVDLTEPTVSQQQSLNARLTAELVDLIRGLEPPEVTVSIGGEIGEVGKTNSTEEELRAFLDQFKKSLARRRKQTVGISKVSIQTGTTHGGVVGPDGRLVEVAVDFDVLQRLSHVAVEEYALAGCVQHGASTLPDELFHEFPRAGTAEIHLATGFQNAIYDHPEFPADLKARIYQHLDTAHADEKKANDTPEQFHYKTRKKAFGPFKRDFWNIEADPKGAIMRSLEERFAFLYRELKVTNTAGTVKQYVSPVRLTRPLVH